jgi:hypothetical protein
MPSVDFDDPEKKKAKKAAHDSVMQITCLF